MTLKTRKQSTAKVPDLDQGRLLEELAVRKAELDVLMAIQDGLASGLEIDAIFELAGERLTEIFPDKGVALFTFDVETKMGEAKYIMEDGKRYYPPPLKAGRIGLKAAETKKPIILSTRSEFDAIGATVIEGTKPSLSGIYIPMIVNDTPVGAMNIESTQEEHAFSEAEIRLATTIARSLSVALENARLHKVTEERNAELAVINSIQDGLASNLDIDAIFELVGARIADIFPGQTISLYSVDIPTGMVVPRFILERGVRHAPPPFKPGPIGRFMIEEKTSLLLSNLQQAEALGVIIVEGTEPSRSGVYSPMVVNDRVIGSLAVENPDREDAFTDNDLRLVTTIANAMGVALQNAELFDETQRRASELAIINDVQAGLSAQLSMEGIYQLVGDRVREIFDAEVVVISRFDLANRVNHYEYAFEKGEQLKIDPQPFNPIIEKFIHDRRTLLMNEGVLGWMEAAGAPLVAGEQPLSVLSVPLIQDRGVIGSVSLQNVSRENAFSPGDVQLLETLAASLSAALENARLFDEVQRSNLKLSESLEIQTATSEILQVMAASLAEVGPVLETVARNASELFDAIDVQIYTIDGDLLRQVAHFGPSPSLEDGETLPLVHGLIVGRAVLERKTIQVEDLTKITKEEYPESVKVRERFLPTRTAIATPLLQEGKAVGAIVVRRNKVELFSDKQISLLSTFANQAAIAIENVRLFKETRQRAQELAIINGVQSALAAKLEIQAIYDEVGDTISKVFPGAQVVDILNYDPETDLFHPRYVIERGKRHQVEPWQARGFRKHVVETGETLLINEDMEAMAAKHDNEWVVLGEFSKSWVGVPMVISGAVRGVISLQHIDRENAFNESDVRLLETLAGSMSVALENARLFKETEERNAELAIINTVQRALAVQLDIRGVYEAVGEKLRQIFDSQTIAIYSADLVKRINTAEYAFEKGKKLEPVSQPFTSLHDHLIELNDTYVFNGNFPEFAARFDDYQVLAGEMPKSVIGVPVISKQGATNIVTLTLQDIDGEKIFSDSDVRLLETLANSMSVALENARLFNETQRLLSESEQRAAELQIINKVQDALASKLDLQAIYELIGDELRVIFQTEMIYIGILEPADAMVHHVYFVDGGKRIHDEPPSVPRGFGGHVIRTRKPLLLNDIDEELMQEYDSYMMGTEQGGEESRSWMGAPIIVGGDVLGVVSIQDRRPQAFTESNLWLLSTLTSSMSVALENARLFDESQRLLNMTEQRAAELQIINSVQEGLASKLEMQAIYDLVGEKIREIFKADTTFIAFHDEEADLIVAPYYTDKGERSETTTRPYGRGLVETIIESGKSLHLSTSEEMTAAGAFNIASPGSDKDLNQSFLGVPIFRGGKAIGATSVQSYREKAFSANDLSLLQTLTNSMSVALENARLFDETQHLLEQTEMRAAELATINTVGQALVAESELEALIELIGEKMRETFHADIVYVALLDTDASLIKFPYTYGEELDPLPLGEGLTSRIIQSGEALLINKEMDKRRAEMGVTRVGKKALSYLGVPIQYGGQTFGVISVQSTSEEERFDQGDLHLLSTIAANVGAALRNAQLFDQVKRQKQYYEAVIENSPAAIVLLDMETNVTGWNPAAERLFGYAEEEALGRNIDDLVAFSEDLNAEAKRYSKKALEEKQVHLLTRRTRKDGSQVEVEVSGLPVSVDGEYVGFIAIYHDVTELQRARLEAEEANKAKSTFLANMSHELRTPLNAIIGFSRIVRRKGADILPEKQVENMDKVLVSADHLLNLINTVLDIAKIEAGRMDVRSTEFDFSPVIDLVVDTSQPLLREGVRVRTDIQKDLPVLLTDEDKLKQILLNLLSNAAKFTHEGEITLAARHDGEWLYVDVNDTGIGVSDDALERIFEDFQQADSSTTREYGGTGLGLPISRSLARLLGGDLTACSIAGEGSTFTLTLPIRYRGVAEAENLETVKAG